MTMGMTVAMAMARIKMGLKDRDGVNNYPVMAAHRANNPTYMNY